MSLHKDQGYLGTHVIGKFGQYCGVRCIQYKSDYYVLEGNQADGYRVLNVNHQLVTEAEKEALPNKITDYIEEFAAAEFYYWDGDGYVRYHSDRFPVVTDEKLCDMVLRNCPETLEFIRIHQDYDYSSELSKTEQLLKDKDCLLKSAIDGLPDVLWSMAAISITSDEQRLVDWFHRPVQAFGFRTPCDILRADGINVLYAYFSSLPL